MKYALAALLWLVAAALIGVAVYLHYFLNTDKSVALLVLGGVVMGYFALHVSSWIIDSDTKG